MLACGLPPSVPDACGCLCLLVVVCLRARAAIHGHDKVFDTNVRLPGLSFTHRGADGLLPVDLAAIGSTPGHARLVTRLLTKAPGLCTSSARTRIKLTPEQVRKLKRSKAPSPERWSSLCRNTLHLAVLGGSKDIVETVHRLSPLLSNEQVRTRVQLLVTGHAFGVACCTAVLARR